MLPRNAWCFRDPSSSPSCLAYRLIVVYDKNDGGMGCLVWHGEHDPRDMPLGMLPDSTINRSCL